jgi:hypothetical protein
MKRINHLFESTMQTLLDHRFKIRRAPARASYIRLGVDALHRAKFQHIEGLSMPIGARAMRQRAGTFAASGLLFIASVATFLIYS